MDLMSISKFSKKFKNLNKPKPVEFFEYIFPENILYDFYNSWNTEDSKDKAIQRIVLCYPSTFSPNLRKLSIYLSNKEIVMQLMNNIEDILIEDSSRIEAKNIAEKSVDDICFLLPDDSRFATTLRILKKNLIKPYALSKLLYWIIIYCIFRKHYTHFRKLYNITDVESFNSFYNGIIDTEDVIKHFYIYSSKENFFEKKHNNLNYIDKIRHEIIDKKDVTIVALTNKKSHLFNLEWKYAETILISSVALPSILTPKINNRKIFDDKCKEGCNFKLCFCEPYSSSATEIINTCMCGDFFPGITDDQGNNDLLIEKTLEKVKKIIEKNTNVECRTLNIRMPYSIIVVENDKYHKNLNHIKIELYTPYISSEERINFTIFEKDNKTTYNFFKTEFENRWNNASPFNKVIDKYNKFSFDNVLSPTHYNFFEYIIKNAKSIKMISPTAKSWIREPLLMTLLERLKEPNFKIEFIILNPNSKAFDMTINNLSYIFNKSEIKNIEAFILLKNKYPNNVTLLLTDYFISNTITIATMKENYSVMRVDNHIWNSDIPNKVKPSMIIPQNDKYGYYNSFLQQYKYIKSKSEEYK